MNKPGNEGDYVVCRILKDIDTFLGADLRTYDLKKEDTVTLPRKNAEVLQEKAVAKILIPPADNIGPAIQVIGSASAAIDCTPSPVPLEKDMKRIGKAIAEKSHDETRKMKFVLSRDKDGNPRVLDYSAIAAYIHEKYHVISFKGTARVYHDGIYIDGKETINHEIKEILDFLRYPKKILEDSRTIWYHILNKEVQLTYPFDSCSNAIPVLNGVIVIDYDRGTWHLEDHDPKFRFTYKLPIVFDELADPGPLDEVFRDWVSEEDVPLLYQLPAQALLQIQGNDFKKAYLIVGEKNTGKTTYAVYLLTAFFGAEFIARVPLQDLAMDRFSLADLEGMILNVYDDLSTLRLDEVGQFKALTGSQNHDILRKRQHRYRGRIYALNIFTCNGLPILNGTLHGDSAFFDRWEILQFTTKFPPDDAFRMALCSPRMLSSLLNRVLEKMIQIRRDNLLRKSTAEDIKEIWLKSSDPFHLQEFIYANFEGDRAQVVELSKDEIHAAFRRFAEDHNWPVLDKDNLCKRLYNRGFYARYPRTGGKRAHVMTGFKWRTDAPNRLPGEPSQQALDTQNGAGGAT